MTDERGFFERMFTEDDGKPSFSRFFLGMTIGFANLWVTMLVFSKGLMPDLLGLAAYLGSIGTITYGYNQAKAAVQAVMTSKTETEKQ